MSARMTTTSLHRTRLSPEACDEITQDYLAWKSIVTINGNYVKCQTRLHMVPDITGSGFWQAMKESQGYWKKKYVFSDNFHDIPIFGLQKIR